MHLSPPNSYSNKVSWNLVFSNFPNLAICPIASAKPHRLLLANPQSYPSSKTFSTLWKGVGCVWVQISSQGMTMGEGRRRGYNDFSLRMSSSLFKRMGVYVVENLSRVFSLWMASLQFLWIMRVYIVWVKGKKVEILQAGMTPQLMACALHVTFSCLDQISATKY